MLNNLGRGLTSIVTDFPTKNMKQTSGYHFYPQIPKFLKITTTKKTGYNVIYAYMFKKKLKC